MALVGGTRLVGGSDFEIYEGHYDQLAIFPDVLDPDNRNLNYETGYTYIASFFKTMGVSFYGFCLIEDVFFYIGVYVGLRRYTKHFGIVILVLLYKLFFYDTMISMRQAITISCFFMMIPLITEKKWIWYYIACSLVATIHNGAYLLYIVYPLIYVKLDKYLIIILNVIFIPTILIGMSGIDVLGPLGEILKDNAANENMERKAEKYFGANSAEQELGIFHTLEYFLLMALLLINLHKINLKNKYVHTSVWMFLCLLPLFTLFRGAEILTREKDYFTIFYAVILGYLVNTNIRTRHLYYAAITLICAFGYYRFAILFDYGAMLSYESWLFNPDYSFFLKY
ncbi:MAG: EpsG family protein [Bacteroides sp.]|nr:EpsG family protein [Bacteroides sp.]